MHPRDRESQTPRRMARGQSAIPVLQSHRAEEAEVHVPKRHAHSARHYLTVETATSVETYRPATTPRHNYSGMYITIILLRLWCHLTQRNVLMNVD